MSKFAHSHQPSMEEIERKRVEQDGTLSKADSEKLRALYAARDSLPEKLNNLEKELHNAGLHFTAKIVNQAIQKIGYELADKIADIQFKV